MDIEPTVVDGVLVDRPYCPNCYRYLDFNPLPDAGETYWRCPHCGWWDTSELIQCLEMEESL